MFKKMLAKLILRRVEKGFKTENVSKTKAGAGLKFTGQSAVVLALAAYVKAEFGHDLPPEMLAAVMTGFVGTLVGLAGQLWQTVGQRDAMPTGGEE